MVNLNKTIWIYWHQGWESAPAICQKCLATWIYHNPDWRVEKLCEKTIGKFIDINQEIPGVLNANISKTHVSDIIRLTLLKNYGGIWVDSTLFCRRPLETWISQFAQSDFFAFSKPAADRLISVWFIYAECGSYIINAWFKLVKEYWIDRDFANHYFWLHYCFNDLYLSDSIFENKWNSVLKLSAKGPHYFAPYNEKLFRPSDYKAIESIEALETPVFKLTYKYDKFQERHNTLLQYLLNL